MTSEVYTDADKAYNLPTETQGMPDYDVITDRLDLCPEKFYTGIKLDYEASELIDLYHRYFPDNTQTYCSVNFDEPHNGEFIKGYHTFWMDCYGEQLECYNGMMYWPDIPEEVVNMQIVSELCDVFRNTERHSDPEYVAQSMLYFTIINPLVPHSDLKGTSVNIPLVGCDEDIEWFRDDHVVCRYNYSDPAVLLNTSLVHGCPTNRGNRLFLTLGGFTESYEEIQALLPPERIIKEI